MIKKELAREIINALAELGKQVSADDVELARPDAKFGDFSTNATMRISHVTKQSPMEFAKLLANSLGSLPQVKKLEVKEPGFINIWLKDEIWQEEIPNVLKLASKYGSNDIGKDKKARVEFVSANPTGPLHFGNARGGPIGDVLASVLRFCGYSVVREYYNNDVGVQVQKLGESIINVILGKPLSEQEYKGQYVKSLAVQLKGVETAKEAGKKAVEFLSKEAVSDCKKMGINFDEIHSESDFLEKGLTGEVINELTNKDFIKESEGAMWFAPNDEFLKDRETVVIKSDKSYTYFATDIAYHKYKFEAGADLVVDILGANHHGHVPRLKAAVGALGFDASAFRVILYQWVRFLKGKEVAKMSKRAGTLLTAGEVLKEVGVDAVRFFILSYDPNSPIDFDLDLAKERSAKNPVYYVQYAHARTASILTKAEGLKSNVKINYKLLNTDYELGLIKQISRLPELVEEIASSFAVHRLTAYAIDLADAFHKFYENCRVLDEKEELKNARLALIKATQTALKNTLDLLGISAPKKM